MFRCSRSCRILPRSMTSSCRPNRRRSLFVDTVSRLGEVFAFQLTAHNGRFPAQGIRNVFYLLLPCCGISFFVIIFFVKHREWSHVETHTGRIALSVMWPSRLAGALGRCCIEVEGKRPITSTQAEARNKSGSGGRAKQIGRDQGDVVIIRLYANVIIGHQVIVKGQDCQTCLSSRCVSSQDCMEERIQTLLQGGCRWVRFILHLPIEQESQMSDALEF